MSHPSPRQWFGLLCGVLNWIVSPSIALSLGAWSPPSTRIKKNVNTRTMNTRTRTFWVPALVSLTAATACLTISPLCGLEPRFVARGWATYVVCIPLAPEFAVVWRRRRIFISPRRRRTPGVPRRWFVSCDRDDEFGRLSHACRQVRLYKPQWLYFSIAVLFGLILPGMALFLGAAPFAKAREYRSAG
jgi:hypothetical protein